MKDSDLRDNRAKQRAQPPRWVSWDKKKVRWTFSPDHQAKQDSEVLREGGSLRRQIFSEDEQTTLTKRPEPARSL